MREFFWRPATDNGLDHFCFLGDEYLGYVWSLSERRENTGQWHLGLYPWQDEPIQISPVPFGDDQKKSLEEAKKKFEEAVTKHLEG